MMDKTFLDKERRSATRFGVKWDAAVKTRDQADNITYDAGILENLSSFGAFLFLQHPRPLGEKIRLEIRIPFRNDNWMSYTAEVVRLDLTGKNAGIAVKFDTARPQFFQR